VRTSGSRMLPVIAVAILAGAAVASTPSAAQAVTCPTVSQSGTVTPAPTPGVDWSGCDLTGAALFSFDLTGVNFSGATLTDASFRLSTLTNADLSGANLTGTSFDSASMTGANLASATVTSDDFRFATLASVNLTAVDLSAADLTDVKSGGISAADAPAALPPNWKLVAGYLAGPYADLTGADLTGADLSGLDLANASMNNANLAGANLTNAQMTTTALGGVRSGGIIGKPASLPTGFAVTGGYLIGIGVNLDGAHLSGLNLSGLDISLARLAAADLSNAVLTGTNLSGSDLTGASMRGATFGSTNLLRANLTGDNLSGLTIGTSNLSLATLRHVNLTGATLSGDQLTEADLTGASLAGLHSRGDFGSPSALPANWSAFYGYLLGPRAGLAGAMLKSDFLYNLDLAGADLTSANLSGVNIRAADLAGARLTRASFTGADLTGAELNGTDAYLSGVTWTGATCPNGKKAGTSGCFPPNKAPQHVPQISLSVRRGVPATAVRVIGTGFKAGERVALDFGSTFMKAARTSSTGRFGPLTITVPPTAQPGLHQLTAAGKLSGQTARAWLTDQADWAQSQFDPDLTGDNTAENTLSPAAAGGLHTAWTFNPAAGPAFAPAIANGIAYVATYDGHLDAVNAATGKKLWAWTLPVATVLRRLTAPATAGHMTYVGGDDGYLYAIGPDGKAAWNFLAPDGTSAPTVSDGVLYVSAGSVYAFNAASGQQLWKANPTSSSGCSAQPAVAGGGVYVSCDDGTLYALTAASGTTLWSYSNGGNNMMAPAVSGGAVYLADSTGAIVQAISTTTHAQLWSYTAGDRIGTAPAVASGLVYVSSFDGNVYALNAATGAKAWSVGIGTPSIPPTSGPVVADGVAYVTSSNEVVDALNAQTGATLWHYSNGHTLQTEPVIANGMIYIGTGTGGLQAFRA
jgi:uncharacterized protein YjbI with pentapeptide repeats/outer membrane protein assembly factor BamB